jgi:hypothetical protein
MSDTEVVKLDKQAELSKSKESKRKELYLTLVES